jgi:hypothetical protein
MKPFTLDINPAKYVFFTYSAVGSVPDPDPPDPHVFGPPGSVSVSKKYGSGSGSGSRSFNHAAKILRNPTGL